MLHWKNTVCPRKNLHTIINLILQLDQDVSKYFPRQRAFDWAPSHTVLQLCSVATELSLLLLLQVHCPCLSLLPQLHTSTSVFLPCHPCLLSFPLLYRKNFCLFSTLCLSLWHSGISASLLPIPCQLSLKIYTLRWVLSIKMPVKNRHAMVFLSSKINAFQNVPLTKLQLQPALTFHLSRNSLETLHICCLKLILLL